MIYLDSAATTFQKPRQVRTAVLYAMEHMSSLGRGGYGTAGAASEAVYRCRAAAAELFGVGDPERVTFTMNATHGLNIAIRSLAEGGGKVVVSGYEHNAVTRPLRSMDGVTVSVARAPLFSPEATLSAFRSAVTPDTKAVICTHVSNVFGDILPIEEIGKLCRERGVPFAVDASQSAGILPIDFDRLGADYLAMPGHKGLYGPQGTGLLLVRSGVQPKPLLHGGTGTRSREPYMPDALPERLEAGTQNVAGIAGLCEGIRFVTERRERIAEHEGKLLTQTVEALSSIRKVRVFADEKGKRQTSVLSFCVAGEDVEETAAYLARQGVAVRAGLHCAPLAHESAGTAATGTVRVSFSAFNTESECRRFQKILQEKYR